MAEQRLPGLLVNSYGFASMTFYVMMALAINYYTYFLTDVALIAAIHLAILLPLTHLVDAISIPFTGSIIQNTRFRWGKFRTWLLFTPVLTFLFFTLTFTNLEADYGVKVFYLSVAYMIAHVSLNFAFNGHLGLISVLSTRPDQRARLSIRNSQFIVFGQIVFSLAVIPMLGYFGRDSETRGFFIVAALLSLFQVFGYWNLFAQSGPYDRTDAGRKAGPLFNLTLPEMVRQVFGNRQLMLIMASDTLRDVGLYGLMSVAVYYFKYVSGNTAWMAPYTLTMGIAAFISSLLAPWFVRKLGKRNIYVYSALYAVAGYLVLRLYGATGPVTYITIASITGFGAGLCNPIRQAMYMDTAEYGFFRTGKNASAFIMSMFTMPVKIGIMLALTVVPFVLALIGYQPGMETTPEFTSSLMNLICLLPAVCYLLSAIVMIFYELTDEIMEHFLAANEIKRANANL